MYEDDIEYADKRLRNTVVSLRNRNPFWVETVTQKGGKILCSGVDLTTEETLTTSLSNIDLTPIRLGFVNTDTSAIFVCRKPMRKDWRQGLSETSTVLYGENSSRFRKTHLVQCALNRYPTLAEALLQVKNKVVFSSAFSRDFAITGKSSDLGLVYRKYLVGKIIKGNVVLDKDKFFLQEHLDEAMGLV